MPESVKDRCTKAHEYIFLLTKQPKYYYDADAIREVSTASPGATWEQRKAAGATAGNVGISKNYQNGVFGEGMTHNLTTSSGFRNKRSVWRVNPKPYKGAHFAVYPPELIEPCILAGTSAKGCCSKCGKPYVRITEKGEKVKQKWGVQSKVDSSRNDSIGESGLKTGMVNTYHTVGWGVDCDCDADTMPCVVLDPFLGSGTTIEVALKHGRNAIGIELNPEYAELAKERLAKLDKALGLSDDREWV